MHRGAVQSNIFLVTLSAGFFSLILDGKVFPVLDAAQAVIAVREAPAVDAEVVRNQEPTSGIDHYQHPDRYPQWVQHVPFHLRFPQGSS